MEAVLIVVGILGISALIVWAAVVAHRKAEANLQALAVRHGLQVVKEGSGITAVTSVRGQRQGKEVRFWTYSTGSGKSRRTWCAVGVRPRAAGDLAFDLRPQGFGTTIMGWFGAREIQVGDPAFDAAWFVRTNQPDFLTAALVPDIRTKLSSLPRAAGDAEYKLKEGLVQFATQGSFGSATVIARLEARLPVLFDLADLAEVSASQPKR